MKRLSLFVLFFLLIGGILVGCSSNTDEIISEAMPSVFARWADRREIDFATEDITINSIDYFIVDFSATQDDKTLEGYVCLFLISYTREDVDLFAYVQYSDIINDGDESIQTSFQSDRESDYLDDVETYSESSGMISEDATVNHYETTNGEFSNSEIDGYLTDYLNSIERE